MPKTTTDAIRRLAVRVQRLSGDRPPPTKEGLLELARDLRCIQIDPIRAVERTQYLVPFSRLDPYDPAVLDELAYTDRQLFEYWAHAASYVLTEDYPIHSHLMRNQTYGGGVWAARLKKWMDENEAFRHYVLDTVRETGPRQTGEIEDQVPEYWAGERAGGVWFSRRNTPMMVSNLWRQGLLAVSHRDGLKKYWDLSDRVHPDWTPREELTPYEVTRQAFEHSLRALGAAPIRQIKDHFTRGRYPRLKQVTADLEQEGLILPLEIIDADERWGKSGPWYVHRDRLDLLEQAGAGDWAPHTTLLSPFDNLICDRNRTELLWDFFFRIEIYVPEKKREYGYYVLPILHGDRLIGRIDPRMDRKKKVLKVQNVYREADAPAGPETAAAVRGAVESLAEFLGASTIDFERPAPAGWEGITK